MNFHGAVKSLIGGANPPTFIAWLQSDGFTTTPDYRQVPAYKGAQTIQAQIQSMSADELKKVEGMNIQGVKRALYIEGQAAGVIRCDAKGGDLFQFPEIRNGPNKTWLAVLALETWPDWVKVVVTLQDDPNS